MSVGNLKTQGDKGVNFGYQLSSLQLLNDILAAVSVSPLPPSTTRTPSLTRVTTAGTVAAGAFSVSVYNAGTTDGVWLGATIKAGEQFTYTAPGNDTLGAFAYTASATAELVITTIV